MTLSGTTAVVPFRLGSQRFPAKALSQFGGNTLLEIAVRHATSLTNGPVVVTGPRADLDMAKREVDWHSYPVEWIPSSDRCRCATDRILEIFRSLNAQRFVSLPIDEPVLDVREVERAITQAETLPRDVAVTFYCDFFEEQDYLSPLSAKLVLDVRGKLLYMSRTVVPVRKDGSFEPSKLKKNVGAFVFPRSFLERLEEKTGVLTELDGVEGLEQLRWLELGLGVLCLKIRHIGFGIDVPAQVQQLEARMRSVG